MCRCLEGFRFCQPFREEHRTTVIRIGLPRVASERDPVPKKLLTPEDIIATTLGRRTRRLRILSNTVTDRSTLRGGSTITRTGTYTVTSFSHRFPGSTLFRPSLNTFLYLRCNQGSVKEPPLSRSDQVLHLCTTPSNISGLKPSLILVGRR